MNPQKTFLSEESLVFALKNQDKIGIQALIDMYSATLGDIIIRILLDAELSKDVLQEVIIKIWYTAGTYETCKGRLFTWMKNIARNYSIDVLRSKRYRNNRSNISINDNPLAIDTCKNIMYNTDTLLIRDLVSSLKPDFCIPLEMSYFQGYTHPEIADVLGLPLGTVKTRIRMAVIQLRNYFN